MEAAAMIQAANGVNTSSGSTGGTKKTSKSSDFSGMLQSKAREVGPGYTSSSDSTRQQVARTSGKQASSSRSQSESNTTTSTTKGPGAQTKSDLKTKSDQERSLVETMVQAAQGSNGALQSLQANANTTADAAAGEEAAAIEGVTANMLMDMAPDAAAMTAQDTTTDGQLLMDQLSDAAAADAVQAAVESGEGSIGTQEAAGPGDMLMDQVVNGNRVVPADELVRKVTTTGGEVRYLEGSQYTSGDAEGTNLPGAATAGQTVTTATQTAAQTQQTTTASTTAQGVTSTPTVTDPQKIAEELARQQKISTSGSNSTPSSAGVSASQDAQGFGPGFAAGITNALNAQSTGTNTGSAGQSSEDTLSQAAAAAHAQAVANAQSTQTPVSAAELQTSQGTVTMKTSEATFTQDIQNVLKTSMPTQDGGKLTIELDPATLGKITINVTYEGDKATVSIFASNPKTLELLTNSAPQMAGIIESKTGQQTTVYIPTNTTASDYQSDFASANQDGSGEGQAEQRRRQQEGNQSGSNAEAFLQQMRLGLV